jgi:hypothetical protein
LLEELQRNIELTPPALTDQDRRITKPSSYRRWLPALGFALWFLGCVVVLGIQASRFAELKRAHDARAAALSRAVPATADSDAARLAAELDQLRKDAADVQRLRAEIGPLRASLGELAPLQEQNRQLRAELPSRGAPPPKPEEDFFAVHAQRAERLKCVNNLKQVLLAARIWANDHGDVLPRDYDSMKAELVRDTITYCPGEGGGRYEILSPGARETNPWIVYARCTVHSIAGLVDGSVQQFAPPMAIVQKDGQWILESRAQVK